jgi:hypothetical protein
MDLHPLSSALLIIRLHISSLNGDRFPGGESVNYREFLSCSVYGNGARFGEVMKGTKGQYSCVGDDARGFLTFKLHTFVISHPQYLKICLLVIT